MAQSRYTNAHEDLGTAKAARKFLGRFLDTPAIDGYVAIFRDEYSRQEAARAALLEAKKPTRPTEAQGREQRLRRSLARFLKGVRTAATVVTRFRIEMEQLQPLFPEPPPLPPELSTPEGRAAHEDRFHLWVSAKYLARRAAARRHGIPGEMISEAAALKQLEAALGQTVVQFERDTLVSAPTRKRAKKGAVPSGLRSPHETKWSWVEWFLVGNWNSRELLTGKTLAAIDCLARKDFPRTPGLAAQLCSVWDGRLARARPMAAAYSDFEQYELSRRLASESEGVIVANANAHSKEKPPRPS